MAINFAREQDLPFPGTCGGYQHAALEFARNALGHINADNGAVNPDAEMPLISGLAFKLVEVSGRFFSIPIQDKRAFTRKIPSAKSIVAGLAQIENTYHS